MSTSVRKGSRRSIYIILCIMALAALFRIILGQLIGNFFQCSETFDDVIMMQYANVQNHFMHPDRWSLVKTMGFPLYLSFIHAIHLNYTLSISIVWVLAALSVFGVTQKYFKNTKLSLFAYFYFLFLPVAFDSWMGTRIYRNSIIAPFVILVFSLMLINVHDIVSHTNKSKQQTAWMIIRTFVFGFVFTFTYYIKEDGLWLLACLAFFSLVCFVSIFVNKKHALIYLIVLCIPFTMFAYGTNRYKQINQKHFGVSAIQTRTSGELGTFVNNVYKVDSKNQDWYVWAPKDSIEKVFQASSTLKKHQDLLKSIEHTTWFGGDISKNPIRGDFLTWVLRSSLQEVGLWKSEKQINQFFAKVNAEIDEAFKSGKLKKTKKIQLLSSAVGRNRAEIFELFPLTFHSFYNALFLRGYTPGAVAGNIKEHPDVGIYAKEITGISYLMSYDQRNQTSMATANKIVSFIFVIYSWINPLFFVGTIAFLIIHLILLAYVGIKKRWRNVHTKYLLYNGLIIVLLGLCFVYSFSINWFSQFIFKDGINNAIMNFYTIALPPMLGFAYIQSIGNLLLIWKGKEE